MGLFCVLGDDMSKDVGWFSHDSNARNDPKCVALILKHGALGYGVWWGVCELLRESDGYKSKLTGRDLATLVLQLRIEESQLQEIIEDMVSEDIELLVTDGTYYWSESMFRRMEKKDAVRDERVAAAYVRWHGNNGQKAEADEYLSDDVPEEVQNEPENTSDANAMQVHSKSNAYAMQADAKRREEKRREIREDIRDVGLSPDQIAKPPPLPITETTKTIITYLNQKAETRFNPAGKAHLQLIGALLKKGYTEADMKKIIVVKAIKWRGDEKMAQYLRPSTLFRPSHVDDYIGEYETEKANAQG